MFGFFSKKKGPQDDNKAPGSSGGKKEDGKGKASQSAKSNGAGIDFTAFGLDPSLMEDPKFDEEEEAGEGAMDIDEKELAKMAGSELSGLKEITIEKIDIQESEVDVEVTEEDTNNPELLAEIDGLAEESLQETPQRRLQRLEQQLQEEKSKYLSLKQMGAVEEAKEMLSDIQKIMQEIKTLRLELGIAPAAASTAQPPPPANTAAATRPVATPKSNPAPPSRPPTTTTKPTTTITTTKPATTSTPAPPAAKPATPATTTLLVDTSEDIDTEEMDISTDNDPLAALFQPSSAKHQPARKSAPPQVSLAELGKTVEHCIAQYKAADLSAKQSADTANSAKLFDSLKILTEVLKRVRAGDMSAAALPLPAPLEPLPSAPAVTATSEPALSASEKRRIDGYEAVEALLKKELEVLLAKAKQHLSNGDKRLAALYYKDQKEALNTYSALLVAKATPGGPPPPAFRYETVSFQHEVVFTHLQDTDLEIVVVRATGVKLDQPALVEISLPFGEKPPPNLKTPAVKANAGEISWNFSGTFPIERKRALLTFVQRKKLIFQLFARKSGIGGLIGGVDEVGKAALPLVGLLDHSEVHEAVDVCMATNPRRMTGIRLEVKARLRTPLQKRDVRIIEEKRLKLAFDGAAAPVADGTPLVAAPAPAATVISPAPPVQRNPPPTQATQPTPNQRKTSTPAQPASAPATTRPSGTMSTAAEPSTAAAPRSAPAKTNAAEGDEDDPHSVDNIISNDVLEWELQRIQGLLASSRDPAAKEELLDRKQQVELKLQLLATQVEAGILTQEAYCERLRAKITEEKARAAALMKKGDKDNALIVMRRVKIMEKELADE